MSIQNDQFFANGNSKFSASVDRDVPSIMPSPLIISLAMLSGAGFLYLLMLYNIVPVHAIDGHIMTIVLAAMGVACSIYGWTSILSGRSK